MDHASALWVDDVLLVTGLDLLSQRPSEEQRLDEPFRSRLIEELERCLVNKERLKLYLRALHSLRSFSNVSADVGEDAYESVLREGLSGLSDRDLMQLARDGSWLWVLRSRISNDGSPYWQMVNVEPQGA